MKKQFTYILSLLAAFLTSCEVGDKQYFVAPNEWFEVDARKELTKYVHINTNIEDWDYELHYGSPWDDSEIATTGWCDVVREANTLIITCAVNKDEANHRSAYLKFSAKGKEYGSVELTQYPFYYTEQEQQIIYAQNILANYNYMNLDVDFDSKHYVKISDYSNEERYYGVFHYTGDGNNLSIPVELSTTRMSSDNYQFHYVRIITQLEDAEVGVSGSIYTAQYWSYNSTTDDYTISHSQGDFRLSISGTINGQYYSKTLENK